MGADPQEGRGAGGDRDQSAYHRGLRSQPRHQPRSEQRPAYDREVEGWEDEARPRGWEPQYLLHVERAEQHGRGGGRGEYEGDEVRPEQYARTEYPERHERVPYPPLHHHEKGQQHDRR